MSSEVLYTMLVGALSALLISAIFAIPKLIAFIVKKLTKKLTKSKDDKDNEE